LCESQNQQLLFTYTKLIGKIYGTIVLPVVLYECETWSVILRQEEHGLGIFDNRVLRKIFEPMWDEETREWRFHNGMLRGL
jgi:hypothetical protein